MKSKGRIFYSDHNIDCIDGNFLFNQKKRLGFFILNSRRSFRNQYKFKLYLPQILKLDQYLFDEQPQLPLVQFKPKLLKHSMSLEHLSPFIFLTSEFMPLNLNKLNKIKYF